MIMCFGAKNSDENPSQQKNDRSIDERSSSETKIDRKARCVHTEVCSSESVLHERNNPDEAPNHREKLSAAIDSENCLPTSKKKLWIIDDKSIDGTFYSETNIVRTVNRSVVNVKNGKIVRSEVKNKIVDQESSNGEKNRRTKDFGVKNSDKFIPASEKKLRIIESDESIDGTFDSETNIVRTVNRSVVDEKNGKIVRSEVKNKIVDQESSNDEKNRRTKDFGVKNSDKFIPTSEKKLRIIESDKSIDGTFDSETNIVRTVNRSVVDVKNGKIVRSKVKSKIDESSNNDKNRETKYFGVKNSDKFMNEEKKKFTETERFVGDGLSLRMDVNERDIEVTGDGCRLTLATNRGRIRMIGDGCRLQIGRNSGDIEYTGDGGRVSLGPDSTGTKVHYVGEGGRVDIADGKIRTGTRNSTNSGRATSSTRVKRDDERSSEILDNILNERRARRTCKTIRIVNIDTKIISNGRTKNSVRTEKSFTQCT